jgi:hypothetical protein
MKDIQPPKTASEFLELAPLERQERDRQAATNFR